MTSSIYLEGKNETSKCTNREDLTNQKTHYGEGG